MSSASPVLNDLTLRRLDDLLGQASSSQLAGLAGHVEQAIDSLTSIATSSSSQAERSERFLLILSKLRDLCGSGVARLTSDQQPDHDYGNLLKLCRSVQFSWGPWTTERNHAAFGPHQWALSQLFAHTDRNATCAVLEIGCGTGSMAYGLCSARPAMSVLQAEPALESLVMAVLVQSGEPLLLPRRVAFDREPDGIGWFGIQVPAMRDGLRYLPASIPKMDGGVDVAMALNSLSLCPDPLAAATAVAEQIRVGGLFLWVDLFCWRIETPAPRRLRGPQEMADFLNAAGFDVLQAASGLPYLEDWGFEREYRWTSHAVLAKRR